MTGVIAGQLVLSLKRQRIFLALMVTLLVMTALAGVIGWSSHRTIVKVYNEAIPLLAASGKSAPPNPFDFKPTLALVSNMVIYIPLIGALMALVLGHLSLSNDQSTGIGRLLFSREVTRDNYIVGKMVGAVAVLTVVLATSFAVSVLSLVIVNGAVPAAGDLGRLAVFYAISLLYLTFFALVGMAAVLVTRKQSMALLLALGVWLVITFVVPQFTSGLRPTASLNPITNPVSTSQTFFDVTAHARPVSISEQYKEVSVRVLEVGTSEGPAAGARRVLPLGALVVGLGFLTVGLVRRHDYSRGAVSE